MVNGTSFLDVRSPGVNFLRKVNKLFSLWRGRLQTPSMASIGWRGHRVRFPPDVQHFSRKCQHPPTNILGRTFRPPWAFCILESFQKTVAPAGYKNKQCRKQTSVLSGRTVTAYVPLRSATERERAAFLIPCQGLRGYLTNFHVNKVSIVLPEKCF